MAGTATGLPLVCHCASLHSWSPHLTSTSLPLLRLYSGGMLKVEGKLEAGFHIFAASEDPIETKASVMNFTVILLLHINNKDMTIMIIKEGNVKIHLNFDYHESTRSLM